MTDTREAVARVIHAGAVGKGFPVANMAPEWMPFLPEADAAISAYRAALEAEGLVVVRRVGPLDDTDEPQNFKDLACAAISDLGCYAHDEGPERRLVSYRGYSDRYSELEMHAARARSSTDTPDPGAAAMRDHL